MKGKINKYFIKNTKKRKFIQYNNNILREIYDTLEASKKQKIILYYMFQEEYSRTINKWCYRI